MGVVGGWDTWELLGVCVSCRGCGMGVDVGYRGSLESHLVVVSIGFVVVACVQMVFGWAQCRNCLARLISTCCKDPERLSQP